MAIKSLHAARHLSVFSKWTLTNLEIQKIIYICHMLYLGRERKELIHEKFQAWAYGPVEPDLYHKFKFFGSSAIKNKKELFKDIDDTELSKAHKREKYILEQGVKRFPSGSGPKLVAITHWPKGAWSKNYKSGVKNITISNEDIIEEYENRQKEYQI